MSSPLVLYDGTCGFCDASVRWALKHDTSGVYRFAPLQGETARAVLARHPEIPAGTDSLVLVEEVDGHERVSWYARAVLRIAARLPFPWRALSWFAAVPHALTDPAYRLVARVRHRVGGTLETCRVPSPAERARFLP